MEFHFVLSLTFLSLITYGRPAGNEIDLTLRLAPPSSSVKSSLNPITTTDTTPSHQVNVSKNLAPAQAQTKKRKCIASEPKLKDPSQIKRRRKQISESTFRYVARMKSDPETHKEYRERRKEVNAKYIKNVKVTKEYRERRKAANAKYKLKQKLKNQPNQH